MSRLEQADGHVATHPADADETEMLACHDNLELVINSRSLSVKAARQRHTCNWHIRLSLFDMQRQVRGYSAAVASRALAKSSETCARISFATTRVATLVGRWVDVASISCRVIVGESIGQDLIRPARTRG
jgi:hypothetical protein